MTKMITRLAFFVLVLLPFTTSAATIYVNGSYNGTTSDGTSWATPYKTIEAAIENSSAGDEIWVAKGTYKAPVGSAEYPMGYNNGYGYPILKDLSIYGSFAGNESSIYTRDLINNRTVLEGSANSPSVGWIFSVAKNVAFYADGFDFTQFSYGVTQQYDDPVTREVAVQETDRFNVKLNNCNFYNGFMSVEFGYFANVEISNTKIYNINGRILFDNYYATSDTTTTPKNNIVLNNVTMTGHAGPALIAVRSNITLSQCHFYNNQGYTINSDRSGDFTVEDSEFDQLPTQLFIISNYYRSQKVAFKRCNFHDNGSNDPGYDFRLVLVDGYYLETLIENCVFKNNIDRVFLSTGNKLVIKNTEIFDNLLTFNTSSEGFFDYRATKVKSSAEIDNLRFENNKFNHTFPYDLLYVLGHDLTLKVTNSEFKNNVCASTASGLRFNGGVFQMDNCLFEQNTSTSLAGSGALNMDYYSAMPQNDLSYISNTRFINNTGAYYGVVRSSLNLTFNSCVFKDNKTTQQFAMSGGFYSTVNTNINNCLFEGNQGHMSGAIAAWAGIFNINNCVFRNNIAKGCGAIMSNFGGIRVNNSLFEGNQSIGTDNSNMTAGAIGLSSAGFADEIRSCTFVKNSTLALWGSNPGAVINGVADVMSNCIFWNNGTQPPLSSGLSGVTYSNVQGGYPGEGNMDVDPKFANFDNGDYRLSCSSPLINKGTNQQAPLVPDLDNKQRIFAGTIDMGAYEFPQDPVTVMAPPVVSFSTVSSACMAELIRFENTTTPFENIRFEWSFGDGKISQLASPGYRYSEPGTYTITLKATNACGASSQTTRNITILPSSSPTINYVTLVCPGQISEFSTVTSCSNLVWVVEGGTIQSGQGTTSISVLWGDGADGNGKVTLNATSCGSGCEKPVSIEIPIVPVNFELEGPDKLCQGATAEYATVVKDETPSTLYTWSVKGGAIVGKSSGYNLHEIDVQWGSSDTLGVVYLTTYNELLRCGNKDSLKVKLRPKFEITGKSIVCENENVFYNLTPWDYLGTFNWTITGPNTINNTNGNTIWGNVEGTYMVYAQAQDLDKVCNTIDSLEATLIHKPVVTALLGETNIQPGTSEVYSSELDGSEIQHYWSFTGGNYVNQYSNQATVVWGPTPPYKVGLMAVSKNGNCMSDFYELNVSQEISFTISGPDTVCIGTSDEFTATTDPENSSLYTWSSVFTETSASLNSYDVTFTHPGSQAIMLEVSRNGKVFKAFKNVYVKAAKTDIGITGPAKIDPQGTGTYIYTVINSQNLNFNYSVVGAASHSRNGNEITVTWGGNAPFRITVVGIVPSETCTGVPAVMEVSKVQLLADQINADAPACLNSRVKYSFVTDEHTSGLTWSISGGGTIISNNGSDITVEWGNTGVYTIGLQYERFGTHSVNLNVNVNSLPVPAINAATICGSNPVQLSTTTGYVAYKWFLEPGASVISTSAQPPVTTEGLYRVDVTDGNGCSNFASKYIKQIPLPRAKVFSYEDLNYCQSPGVVVPISLKTFEGQDYEYQWYKDNLPIPGADSSVYPFNLSLNTAVSNNYKVIVSLETCVQEATPVAVSVYPISFCNGGVNCTDTPVSFNVQSVNGCQPFTFQNTTPEIDFFGWNFGDGTFSSLKNPAPKSYTDVGVYTVWLNRKCSSVSHKVEVPAIALFKLENPACQGQEVNFNELSVNIPGRPILSWEWNFGDGNTLNGSGNIDRDVAHVYTNTGSYTVTLTVNAENSLGQLCSNTYTKNIEITAPPVANFTTQAPPCTDNVYKFTDNSTYQYSTAKYLWNFGNGETSTLPDPSQRFDAGSYSVQLNVTDLLGCSGSKSQSINVVAPVAVGTIQVTGDTILCNGRTTTLTSPSAGPNVWRRNGIVFGGSGQSEIVSQSGSYTVTYQVGACYVTTPAVVLKDFEVPNLLSGNTKACVGESFTIKTNLDRNLYSFAWKFGAEELTSKAENLIVNDLKLSNSGNYTVTVTDNKKGCSMSLPSYGITVYEKPAKPDLNSTTYETCFNGSFTLSSTATAAGHTFTWYRGDLQLASGPSDQLTLTNITGDRLYTLKLTEDATGCSSLSDSRFVRVAPLISVNITGDNLACELTPVAIGSVLSANDYNFQWYKDSVLYGGNQPKISFASVASTDSGTYYLVATSKGTNNVTGCQGSSNSIKLTVKPAPVKPEINGPATFCTGNPITLTTNLTNNFSWNTGASSSSIQVSLGGVYSVSSVNPVSGCEITAFKTVVQNPLPDLSFFPEGVYERCGSDKIVFEGLNDYPVHNWYIDGVLFSSANNLYPTKSGNYSLEVISDSGCVAYSDTMRITSLDCPCYVTNTNDSGLGSLREALECSNSKPGKDVIQFAIPGAGPFTIQPLTALPVISDPVFINGFSQSGYDVFDIIIDGAFYKKNALVVGSNIDDNRISGLSFTNFQNAISISSLVNATVIDSNQFSGNTLSAVELLTNSSGNTLSNNTIQSSGNAIVLVASSSSNTISKNTITNSKVGIGIYNASNQNSILSNDVTGSTEHGIWLNSGSQQNTISGNSIGTSTFNGIYIDLATPFNTIDSNYIGIRPSGATIANGKSGIHILTSSESTMIRRNIIGNNLDHGVLVESKNTTIRNNYIGTDKNGNVLGNKKYGVYTTANEITIYNNDIANNEEYGVNILTSSFVTSNRFKNNTNGGVDVDGQASKISKNAITNTNSLVKAIDLHFVPGPAGNNGKLPGTFTSYRRSTNGIILKGTSLANDTIEVFTNNTIDQQAVRYAGSAKADASGVWEVEIPVGPSFDPNQKNYYVNTATDGLKNTSELSQSYMTGCFNCICTVTNTNDAGSGSLRAEVDSANTGKCLTINFSIATPDTIELLSSITPVAVPVAIVGTPGGADPLIFVKGNGIFNCFTTSFDGVSISDLGFTNFSNAVTINADHSKLDGIEVLKTDQPVKIAGNYNQIIGSGINTYLSGAASEYIADTLVYITGNNNQIGALANGNILTNASAYGVLVSSGENNSILFNSIYDNTVAIAHANNGNNLHPKPHTLTGATLSGVSSITGKASPNDKIQIFTSSYANEHALTFVTEVTADGSGNWNVVIPASFIVPGQNNYFVATATNAAGNTSPLSLPVRVGNNVQVCYVTNTQNAGKGSLREAVNCANIAGSGLGVPARIAFQLPITPNEIAISSGYTITNNYGVEINPYQIPVSIKAHDPSYAAFTWATNNFKIKNLTFENFETGLLSSGSNAIIDSNYFVNTEIAILNNASSPAVVQTITNNRFAGGNGAIVSTQGSLNITSNTIGKKQDGTDAVVNGAGVVVVNSSVLQMNTNTIANIATGINPMIPASYNGVPVYVKNAVVGIYGNTINGNATSSHIVHLVNVNSLGVVGNTISNGAVGIRIDTCSDLQVTNNTLTAVTGKGIDLRGSDRVLMSRNTVSGLTAGNKPIDLNLSTLQTSNNSKIAPVILTSTYHDNKLHLIGQSESRDVIEVFFSDNQLSDLDGYAVTTTADSTGVWIGSVSIPADQVENYYFRATAKEAGAPRTSEASNTYHSLLKVCLVTTQADVGAGSLREAIDKANNNTCNLIQFNIPVAGVADIQPASNLPVITAPLLIIDATSQPGYTKGNPRIELVDNMVQDRAFSAIGSNQFNLYGIKITGYDTSAAVTGATIAEFKYNHLADFAKAGIAVKTPSFIYGNVTLNRVQGSGEYGMYLSGTDKIVVDSNSINGTSKVGIYSIADGHKIINNTIATDNITTSVGIGINGGTAAYVNRNKVRKAYRAIAVTNAGSFRIDSNTIGTLDPTEIAAGNIVEDAAVYLDNTSKGRVYDNMVNKTNNGIYVTNSFKPLVENTVAQKVKNSVINIINCDSAIVSDNTLDSVKTGIYISASKKTMVQRNIISTIGEYGVFLDTGADSTLFLANIIGVDFFNSPEFSEGEGIHIRSSYNVVGGFNSDSVTNYVFHNKKGGIIVDGGKFNLITYNQIFENDKTKARPTAYAIDLKNNGNNLMAKPVIEKHQWVGGMLHLSGTSTGPSDSIHVYLGKGGYEEARTFMGSARSDAAGDWTVIIDTTEKVEPLSTMYLTATATDLSYNTSPLSDMYILGDCYVTSLEDTLDNDYPMPNSLRMAVKCANVQNSHVGIYFKVDQYGPKDVELQIQLQPIKNPYGVTFNGRNLITDNLPGGIDGAKLINPDTLAWEIAVEQGPSVFDSLYVKNWKNGIKVSGDSIMIRGFEFVGIDQTALTIEPTADLTTIASSLVDTATTAILIKQGAKVVEVKDSRFTNMVSGIRAADTDTLYVSGNTFGTLNDPVVNSIVLNNLEEVDIQNNTFVSGLISHKAFVMDNVSNATVNDNTFSCKRALKPVEFANSTELDITGNTFTDSADVYLYLNNTSFAEVHSNIFQRPDSHSIRVNASDEINIYNNYVQNAPQDAFDLIASEKILVSKNSVRNVRRKSATDSALCINIHKGVVGKEANFGRQEPFNLGYSIKKSEGRRGLFVSGKATPGDSIEVFFSDSINASMNQYVATGYTEGTGLWEVKIPREFYFKDTTSWYHFIAVAIDVDSNTSQTSSVLHIPPVKDVFYVRNTYDAGPNSLRDALEQVNSSDFFTRVIFQIDWPEFQPGPYRIQLDSLVDPVYSFLGFVMDGETQVGSGMGADQRIIVEGERIGKNYGLAITDSSDVNEVKNLWFNNAAKGLLLTNDENKVENLYFVTRSAVLKQDTALVVTGLKNELKGIHISNYHTGIVLTEGAGENEIIKSSIDSTGIAIVASDSAYMNLLEEIEIFNSYETAILTDSAGKDNVFTKIIIGGDGNVATGIAVTVNNSESQSFTNNRISFLDPHAGGRTSSAFLITGKSSNNYFYANKIGVDSAGTSAYNSDVRGFTIIPSSDGTPSNNSIIGNQISGTGGAAIYAYASSDDIISENLIGADSTRTIVFGIDSTGIHLVNCTNIDASDNIVMGYKTYGVELVSSDNIKVNRNVMNSTFTLNKAININKGTVSESNGGLNVPLITQGVLLDTSTVRLSGTSQPGAAVEVYQSIKDTVQSTAYITKVVVTAGPGGNWEATIPSDYFAFDKENCFVVQNHVGSRSSEFSNSYRVQPLLCQLASMNPAFKLLQAQYTPCPGPDFVLDGGLGEGLMYKWKSDRWSDTITSKTLSLQDTATNLVLKITDNFGCVYKDSTDVLFKARPINPDFIVSSNVYAGDTIMLIDISLPVPTEYTWYSSDGVTVVNSGSADTIVGTDGKLYPSGTRFLQFILPDSGSYNIRQTSLRDGCFVELEKDLLAGPKDPNVKNPYYVAPEIQSLSAYPNPSIGKGVVATVKTGTKEEVTLSLVTNMGSVLWTQKLSGKEAYEVKLPDIQGSGLYLLKLTTEQKEIVFKVVVD